MAAGDQGTCFFFAGVFPPFPASVEISVSIFSSEITSSSMGIACPESTFCNSSCTKSSPSRSSSLSN
ncbi:hypothetical protein EUTSA_v10029530mg [Eutrema salsugineum]|uniref:Uncharacterized protein n=1 Tax=Eutrema salsugineum TaxID=72664 RepID=V4LFQ3_EUTSA|nr:hypothetical protein EUTSA_v10029530mg [Eutrema salsugineum]